ncbi:hypothetical protein STA1M1_12230 [Sinisalibacter aestuarii]|uniref:Uncharacterized protein n=1 Tax=Sinisalibacter aestuarii TaxID=2949426 RepID=A0ABQ5LR05_9RHOB|nr:hypothetical protein STA1M1_12230 [Sinisalibacter aestuarii]
MTWASHIAHFDRSETGAAKAGPAIGAENKAVDVITKWRLVNMNTLPRSGGKRP